MLAAFLVKAHYGPTGRLLPAESPGDFWRNCEIASRMAAGSKKGDLD